MRSQSFGQLGAQWAVMSQRAKLCSGEESLDIKLPLTMFTLNPNPCLLRLLPTTLFASEFVACFGFSLMITFYAAIYLDGWKMQHVWQDFDCFLKWVLKVVSWIVWVEVVFIQTKQSPKIGDKAPPLSFVPLHPLTTEVWILIRDLQLRHGQPCQPLSATSSFRESAHRRIFVHISCMQRKYMLKWILCVCALL